ncbi:MAG: outer membrane lipoprotein carrier protein LolA [Flavobacteriales bacterium]|nr:outer membrane lipoprotein carrier protein LolA [Flavobacteriales bacterium]
MKTLITTLVFSVFTFTFAQKINPESSAILQKVKNYYTSKSSYKIEFQYELDNPKLKIKQKENGILYSQGNKYNLNVLGITQIYDGKKSYQISHEDEEVTVSSSSDEDMITPTKIFETYTKGYTIEKPKKAKLFKRPVYYIKLIPQKQERTKSIVLGIDRETNEMLLMKEYNTDGSTVTLVVSSFDYKTKLSSSLFTFDKNKYKDYYITNLD